MLPLELITNQCFLTPCSAWTASISRFPYQDSGTNTSQYLVTLLSWSGSMQAFYRKMGIFHPSCWGSLGKEGKSTQGPTASLKKFLESDIFTPNCRSCSRELKVSSSDNRRRTQATRSPDPLLGIHFILAVDEKQETVMTLEV